MIKNVLFDFGGVIAEFNPDHLVEAFTDNQEDFEILKKAFFGNQTWEHLDDGSLSYDEFRMKMLELIPERLHDVANRFMDDWYKHMPVLPGIPEFLKELKEKGYHLYILSNASEFFAERSPYYGVADAFDGIVFSACIRMAKPNPEIYQYILDTYHLEARECLFLDDRQVNIEGAEKMGIHGMVFTGDIEAVREKLRGLG